MAIGGGMSCVKYLLFCFNLLFAITGLTILIVGIMAKIKSSPYINLTDQNFYVSAPIVMILVGVIVFIVAFFGCCGAVKENHCMIITFSVFLLIIFIAELSVGIAGYMKRDNLSEYIVARMNETIKEYPNDLEVQKTYDLIQTDLHCCGIYGPADWKANGIIPLPGSCCSARIITNGKAANCSETDTEHLYKNGCLNNIVDYLKSIAMWLGGFGLGVAFIQLLGVVFACCLARSIRSQYETV